MDVVSHSASRPQKCPLKTVGFVSFGPPCGSDGLIGSDAHR